MFRLPVALLSLALLGGCLTPQMGLHIEEDLHLVGPLGRDMPPERPGPASNAFDRDASLPARIWYFDATAQIYHERRTNTYVVWDALRQGWVAASRDQAFHGDFRAERATLLVDGAPPPVEHCIDGLLAQDPNWRGT